MNDQALRRLVPIATLWLAACAATTDEAGEDTAVTTVGAGGSGSATDAATSGALPTSTSASPGTTGGPGDDAGSTSDGTADETGQIRFDLGVIPDAPEGSLPGCQAAVDIVFVMDVSTTMAGFLNIMSGEILAVDAAIQSLELDQPTHYGLVVFVDDTLLVDMGQPYLDPMQLQADFDSWAAFTSSNQQVGGGNTNSTWPENSLDALALAAEQFQWRPAASTIRIVIHTTDDTFWDGPTTGNGVAILDSYADTVAALQNEEVRVYSFADDIGGSCECEDVSMGWSTPYMGMLPIPEATDGLVYDIQQVLAGTVSLDDAIEAAVAESYCDPYTAAG